jgi:hypothetical protein
MAEVRLQLLDYIYDGADLDWNKSVVGELDVTSHSEFPLALTFTIADIKDINARKGSFSKTFKIIIGYTKVFIKQIHILIIIY